MYGLASRISMAGLMAGALMLSGCASIDAVEHAQATADEAMTHAQAGEAAAARAQSTADAAGAAAQRAQSTADAAGSAAQRAQSTADAANSAAQAAQTDAHAAIDRLDKTQPQVQHLMHHHKHRTWKNVAHKAK
jgi:hypothetical protein